MEYDRAMDQESGCTVITPAETDTLLTWGKEHTGGAYTTLIGHPSRHPSTSPSCHPATDEAFYVAEGTAAFRLGDERISAGAGSLVFVPRGTVHTAWNERDGPIRGVIIISPANVNHEFVVVQAEAQSPP